MENTLSSAIELAISQASRAAMLAFEGSLETSCERLRTMLARSVDTGATSAFRPVPSVSTAARGARLAGRLALGGSSPPPARSPPRIHPGSPGPPGSPPYGRGSPAYSPPSPAYSPCSPAYSPCSPAYSQSSPAYSPCSPAYSQSSPAYSPCSPAPCSPQFSASGGGDRGTKRKRTTGFDCDDSEVKVVRVRTAEDRVKEAHDNNEVADLS